jgi:hypothetical protein
MAGRMLESLEERRKGGTRMQIAGIARRVTGSLCCLT